MTRSRQSAKAAGTRFETQIAGYLAEQLADDRIERRAKSGSKDRGDIGGVRSAHGGRVVIECKDVVKLNLAGWVKEAETERGNDDALVGLVVHKVRGVGHPGSQYVTMTVDDLIALLCGHRDCSDCWDAHWDASVNAEALRFEADFEHGRRNGT